MNAKETTKISKNLFPILSLPLSIVALSVGLISTIFTDNSRQYSPGKIVLSGGDKGGDKAMMQYFFNARRNIKTNTLDYQSMLAANIADRAMSTAAKTHHALTTGNGLSFNWNSLGPTNIGGRTRAFLIDNNDPTHQTLFAGGVSGGIWKSTDGGGSWGIATTASANYADNLLSQNDTLSNMNVCCISQDANGAIYIGTGEGFAITKAGNLGQAGEGFSSGLIGGGIFKSTDDGNTWTLLSSTVPSANQDNIAWAFVNRIAIRPDNPNVIYAATNGGIYVSHNAGTTWKYVTTGGTTTTLNGNSLDVKISADGSVLVACIGGFGYYCYPKTAPDSIFSEIDSIAGPGRLNRGDTAASRIEFAISPTDANRIYASYVDYTGLFGAGAKYSGIFMTTSAKTNGGHWIDIGPGGSIGFDPYAIPGGTEQPTFNNTLGIVPNNEEQLLCGGSTIWEWSGANSTDTIGAWEPVTHYFESFAGDPLWIQPGQNAIVFDQNTPTTAYIACAGGLYKSSNLSISPSSPESSIADIVFNAINRDYNVTQYYSVCYSPEVNYNYNNTTNPDGLGVGGGTQDNGSPYINGLAFNPCDGTDLTGGNGGGSVVSSLDPNVAYFSADGLTLLREANLGVLSITTSPYTSTIGLGKGGNIDSVYALGGACPVFPVALYENPYDTFNKDSLQYIASKAYAIGDTIWPMDPNGPTSYPYVLTTALPKGDTITVPDRVVSRIAIGFNTKGGIWINGQAASNTSTVVWMPIGGPLSKPDAFKDTNKVDSAIHCLSWAPDGNTLYVGTEGGLFFRFSNINSVIANKYSSGALWSEKPGIGTVANANCQIVSTNLSSLIPNLLGRDILSIAVDPNNANNMMVTLGNYGGTAYVYYTGNALAATPTFTSAQGNLPDMPVYSSILDIMNSTGQFITNSAMIATEHGVYTTSNITAGSPTWTKTSSTGLPDVITLQIKQQSTPAWLCNNSGVIYAGTHGRGLWAANDNHVIPTSVPQISTSVAANTLFIYPCPMTSQGNIEFNLASADNVTVTIYDMQGREMKTINMGQQSPGNHLVTFESSSFSAGTYFASLTGNNFKKVSKFVVVK